MATQVEINDSWQQVTKKQVFEMAARGDIQPETIIDVDGQKIPASRIRDIVFAEDEHLDILPPNIVPPKSDSNVTFPIIFEITALTGGKVKLEIYENKIVIERIGVMSFALHGLKGAKTLYFSKISAVQFKRAGVTGGYLQFTIPGGWESKHGWFDAHTDENTIRFGFPDDEIMSCVHKFIEAKIENEDSRNAAINLQHVFESEKGEYIRKQRELQQSEYIWELVNKYNKDIETLSKEEREILAEKNMIAEPDLKYLEEIDRINEDEKLSEEEKEKRKRQMRKERAEEMKRDREELQSCMKSCMIWCTIILAILFVIGLIVETLLRFWL
jgi:hypothetical protein